MAGNLLGSLFVSVMASAMWIVLGFAIDKVANIFNHTLQVLPSFQDAANGFTITQTIWGFLLVVIWIAIWFNYAQNEASESGGYV